MFQNEWDIRFLSEILHILGSQVKNSTEPFSASSAAFPDEVLSFESLANPMSKQHNDKQNDFPLSSTYGSAIGCSAKSSIPPVALTQINGIQTKAAGGSINSSSRSSPTSSLSGGSAAAAFGTCRSQTDMLSFKGDLYSIHFVRRVFRALFPISTS